MPAPVDNANQVLRNRPWADALRRSLARHDAKGVNALNIIADHIVTKACEGDMAAINEIANRLDGKPKQQIENTGLDGGPFQIQLIEAVQAKRMAQEYAAE